MAGKKIGYLWQGWSLWQKDKKKNHPHDGESQKVVEYHLAENNGIGVTKRTVARTVKIVADKVGISKPVSPHVLRYTFSVNCIKKGLSTRALQTLLGHDRLTTTEIYLNLSPEDAIREFLNKW